MSSKKTKKKILIHSNYSRAKTGFGKHMRHLLTYLYKTKKYEVIELANGRSFNDPELKTLPWKAFGSLPRDENTLREIKSDPKKQRLAGYGHYGIDQIIKDEKPDIYLGIEDVWGLENFWKKTWWSKINSIIWTPIDSLPILDKHIDASKYTNDLIVQASFAQKALIEKSQNNTHLFPVPVDVNNFFKIEDSGRQKLRESLNIDSKDFIIGFVFRNQLRKSVPNLLDGFKKFQSENPNSKAKLLLHTHWSEGWDIPRLIKEKEINPQDILTTYYCSECNQYEVKPFTGQKIDCPKCGAKKSQETSQINRGISEKQLNEVYNLMDVYCHPFTSGGQEIPIQEAKLTELITLVTNYSCGEDYCSPESGGLPLNWSEYREPGTQFIKASTSPEHISEQLSEVYNMRPKERLSMGKKARSFTIDFCSIDSVCVKFEKLISELPDHNWDFDMSYVPKNVKYVPPEIKENRDWIIDLYKNILNIENPEKYEGEGIKHWELRLNKDLDRQKVYNHFIQTANKYNQENQKLPFESLLDKDDEGNRILFVMPENEIDVFNSTSLLKYIKDKNQDCNIYFATKSEYFNILQGNPHIHKVIPYDPIMNTSAWSEGSGEYKGMFRFCLLPYTNTHINGNYIHNGNNQIEYDINYA